MSQHLRISLTRWSPAVVAAGLLPLLGCSDKDWKPVYPVSGKVTLDGRPLPRAEVWLVPRNQENADARTPVRPRGISDNDGNLTLTTYMTGDGAPAGEYGTVVVWDDRARAADEDPETPRPPGRRRSLPPRYANPDTSGLSVTVRKEANTVTLELKSK